MPSNRVIEFYQSESFAILGLSQKKRNFAWSIFKAMKKLGKPIYPIHPDGGTVRDIQFYDSLSEIDKLPEAIIVCLNLDKVSGLLEKLRDSGIKEIWFQQGSYNAEHLKKARKLGLDPVTSCVLMYMPGTSLLHRIHGFFHDRMTKG
jgi:predicted CoA-binding protein